MRRIRIRQIAYATALFLSATYANAETVKGIEYELDTKYEIATVSSDQNKELSGDVVIPQSFIYNGVEYYVSAIADNAFNGCTEITSITMDNNVTEIGVNAFSNCTNLTSVKLSTGIKTINAYTFYGCSNLTSISIPSNVISIGEYAFWGCSNLTSVNIPSGVTAIANYTFYECNSLADMKLPENVTSIGEHAFDGCSGMESINIPETVSQIGTYAFFGCTSLTEINIPSSLTEVNEGTFQKCSSLKSVTIPQSVTEINARAFRSCTSLTDVSFFGKNVELGASIFIGCNSLQNVHIPVGYSAAYTTKLAESYSPATFNFAFVEDIVTIGSTGYATACSATSALDFSTTGVTAYAAAFSEEADRVILEKVNTTAIGEGIVIQGEEGVYQIPTTGAATAKNEGNELIGTTEPTLLKSDDATTYYALTTLDSGNAGFGVIASSGVTVSAGKAYLAQSAKSESSVKAASLEFGFGQITGINSVKTSPAGADSDAYITTSGIRVNTPEKGLYIKGGKKVYVK